MAKKENWFERLERYSDEVRHSRRYKVAIAIGASIVGLIMLVIVIAGFFVE